MINKKRKYTNTKSSQDIKANRTILESGMTVVSEQSVHSPSFALGFCIKSGSAADRAGFEGTAHFMEHIAFRRTRSYTGRRLVTEFESIGAYINAFTTKEMTCFYVMALNKNLKKCLRLLSEVVFYPNIKPSDLEKERSIILEEISGYDDDPEELIFDNGEKLLFRGSRFEHQITGSAESVIKIQAEHLNDFHSRHYSPANIVISYSGPEEHSVIAGMSEDLNILSTYPGNLQTLDKPKKLKPRREVFDKNFQQSHLLYSIRTDGMSSKDRYVYAVISNILGEGLSSRLNQNLREKHGYVYTVYTSLSLLKSFGTLGIYAAVDKKNLGRVEELIKEELLKTAEKGFSDKELKSAKEQIKSSTIMALEGVSAKMQSLARFEAASAKHESIMDTISLVDEVSNEEILRILQKKLTPEKWSEVIFKS